MTRPVVLATLEFPPDHGGVATMYEQLSQMLGESSIVLAPARNTTVGDRAGVRRVQLLNRWGPARWLRAIPHLIFFARRNYVVLVGQILPLGLAACVASYVVPFRYAVIVHGMDVTIPLRTLRKRMALRFALRRASSIVAANHFVAAAVRPYCAPGQPIVVVHPSVRRSEAVKSVRSTSSPSLLTVGRLVRRKGVDIVLNALELIWQRYPDCTYNIVGEGPERQALMDRASRLSRPENVRFHGSVTQDQLEARYRAADIFILTPYELSNGDVEGLGIVYLEASARGLPVIGTRHGGVAEAVRHEATGILVAERDAVATAEAVLRLLGNASLRHAYGEQGKKFVADEFSTEQQAAALNIALDTLWHL